MTPIPATVDGFSPIREPSRTETELDGQLTRMFRGPHRESVVRARPRVFDDRGPAFPTEILAPPHTTPATETVPVPNSLSEKAYK